MGNTSFVWPAMRNPQTPTANPTVKMNSHEPVRWVVPDLPTAEEILPYLRRIDETRWYSNFGPLEGEFREALVEAFFPDLQPDNITTACSGALAIEIALIAHQFPPGSRVLVPSYTFVATAAAIVRAGYIPVFADVDIDTLQLNPEHAGHLARVHGCAAVVPVGPAGMEIPTGPWDQFVEDSGIPVILDAAAGLGNQPIGRHLTVAFSLHATKPLGVGEGGLVISRNKELIARARSVANFGLENGRGQYSGTNAKMSEYHAAVGLAQLKRRDGILERRMAALRAFEQAYPEGNDLLKILTPSEKQPANLIVLFHEPQAKEFQQKLAQQNIETRRLYIPPVHRHPAYQHFPSAEPMNNCEKLSTGSLSFPAHFKFQVDTTKGCELNGA